jgi:hypothetical protein
MLALLLAALLPILPADQASKPASRADAPQPAPLLPARALSQLFTIPAPRPDGTSPLAIAKPTTQPRTKVVCGMTLVIVDGSADPKFAVAPRPGGSEPVIRRVPKPMCGEKGER